MSARPSLQRPRLVPHAVFALALFACAHPEPAEPPPPDVPPVSEAAPPREEVPADWRTYLLQPGDTLGRLAACRGVSVATLARANGLVDPDRVMAGRPLRVPATNRCARAAALQDGTPSPPSAPTAAEATGDASTFLDWTLSEQRARELLEGAQARYDAADFEGALAGAVAAAGELAPFAGQSECDALRARCYLLAGMAEVALDHRERAMASFRAAFALDPQLSLRREDISPRILELVDQVRPGESGAVR